MARRGQTTTLEERIEIAERWETGQTDPEIATEMCLSVWTVRKWRRKYQQEGRTGLVSRMGTCQLPPVMGHPWSGDVGHSHAGGVCHYS